MEFTPQRPNRFSIDLQVIGDNVAALRRLVGPQVRFFATLKADAYGFGVLPVAATVLAAGADALSVVRLEDGIALREAGITCQILLYAGYVADREYVRAVDAYDLTPTLHDRHSLEAMVRHLSRRIGCAIKIDAGQERIGVRAEDLAGFAADVHASGKLRIDILNTHPHVIDGNYRHLLWQFERFMAACQTLQRPGEAGPLRLFASSRVLANRCGMVLSGIDPGQALFRLPARLTDDGQPGPTPFAALTSRLIHVFAVQRDAYPDDSPVPVRPGTRIGIVPLGYGDGIARMHAGAVLVRGTRAPIAAPPSVEYTRIDLSGCPEAEVGDEVAFVGRQGDACITPEEVMRHTGVARVTDLVLPLGPAVPRHYAPWQHRAPATQVLPETVP